jgi:hypothetical protein
MAIMPTENDTIIKPIGWDWHYSTIGKLKYIKAYYILKPLSENNIVPEKYAAMIQYTECLIDTTNLIFLKDAASSESYETTFSKKELPNIFKFLALVEKFEGKPKFKYNYSEKDSLKQIRQELAFDKYREKDRIWDSLRINYIRNILSKTDKFKSLLDKAIQEALEKRRSNTDLEYYIAEFKSKQLALQLKRSRRVRGSCSMDSSPRIHAQEIAQLSAESINWEVFLRAHLDIMNDRFDRRSDGSYAYRGRSTYIAELEALGINVEDLLIGTCLRVNNVAKKHYFGNISRIGRALSESQNRDKVEEKMLNMIQDKELDMYNRMLIGYLFGNYNYFLLDKTHQDVNRKKYNIALSSLPEYIGKYIDRQMNSVKE